MVRHGPFRLLRTPEPRMGATSPASTASLRDPAKSWVITTMPILRSRCSRTATAVESGRPRLKSIPSASSRTRTLRFHVTRLPFATPWVRGSAMTPLVWPSSGMEHRGYDRQVAVRMARPRTSSSGYRAPDLSSALPWVTQVSMPMALRLNPWLRTGPAAPGFKCRRRTLQEPVTRSKGCLVRPWDHASRLDRPRSRRLARPLSKSVTVRSPAFRSNDRSASLAVPTATS